MVELKINKAGGPVWQMLALLSIKRVEPDRNWTRIFFNDGTELLAAQSYKSAADAIKLAMEAKS